MEETGLDYGVSVRIFHVSCGTHYLAIFIRLPLFTKATIGHWIGLFPKDLPYTFALDKSLYKAKYIAEGDSVENRAIGISCTPKMLNSSCIYGG